jgi:hypothetical protein
MEIAGSGSYENVNMKSMTTQQDTNRKNISVLPLHGWGNATVAEFLHACVAPWLCTHVSSGTSGSFAC